MEHKVYFRLDPLGIADKKAIPGPYGSGMAF